MSFGSRPRPTRCGRRSRATAGWPTTFASTCDPVETLEFESGDRVRSGWVEDVVAPERLAFWWATGDEPASRVELKIEERDAGSRLRVVETRPLEVLDLVGVPLPGVGGATFGPALVAA